MENKLKQLNDVIQRVVHELESENDTLLLVLGDHGMTRTGDHGGDSADEVTSAFFAYSAQRITPLFPEMAAGNDAIQQVDFVPTLCLLLGVPIPFSNVGKVVSQLFSFPLDCNRVPENAEFTCIEYDPQEKCLWTSIAAERINIAQVERYIFSYHQQSALLPLAIQRKFDEWLEGLDFKWVLLKNLPSSDKHEHLESLIKLRNNYGEYLTQLKSELNQVWASYDLCSIGGGLLMLGLSVMANYFAVCIMTTGPRAAVISVYKKIAAVTFLVALLRLTYNFFLPSYAVAFHIYGNDTVFLGLLTSILIASYYGAQAVWRGILSLKLRAAPPVPACEVVTLALFAVQFALFFSNSSVVNEDSVAYYLLTTHILFTAMCKLKAKLAAVCTSRAKNNTSSHSALRLRRPLIAAGVLLALLRLSKELFFKCREEQYPCEDSFMLKPILSIVGELGSDGLTIASRRTLFACGVGLFMPIATTWLWHKRTGVLSDSTVAALCLQFLLPFAALCVAVHFLMALVEPAMLKKHFKENLEIGSRMAGLLSAAAVALTFAFPLVSDNKGFFTRTVNFFAATGLMVLCVYLPLCMWLGDGGAAGLSLMWSVGALTLYLWRSLSDGSTNHWTLTYTWFLLANYGFFVSECICRVLACVSISAERHSQSVYFS